MLRRVRNTRLLVAVLLLPTLLTSGLAGFPAHTGPAPLHAPTKGPPVRLSGSIGPRPQNSSIPNPVAPGSDWHELYPPTSPPARAQESFAYDPTDQYVVAYSGFIRNESYNDTWTYQGGVWTNITPTAGGPGPRRSAMMVWDAADGYVLMFGGSNGATYFNDTWSFLGGHWQRIDTVGAPPARRSYGLAYDAAQGEVVLFGGHQGRATRQTDFTFLNDTWTYRGGVWTHVNTTVAPSVRGEPNLVWDGSDGCVLLFGGYSNSKGGAFGDTWLFCDGTWTNLTASLSSEPTPPPRDGAGLDYLPEGGYVLMTGGHSGGRQYNDTWAFADRNWTRVVTSDAPGATSGDRIAWDPLDGYALFFGGNLFTTGWQNTTWAFYTPSLRFQETGLPAGVPWSLSVDGTNVSGNGSTRMVPVANGSHSFAIAPVPGFETSWAGSVNVSDDVVVVPVPFEPVTYVVDFNESGLAGGVWNVTFDGGEAGAPAGSDIGFAVTNGTYPFAVGAFRGYMATGGGNLSVNGSDLVVNVSFQAVPTYEVDFNETGLANGTWSVTVDGETVEGSAGTPLAVLLQNGSYPYTVGTVYGYAPVSPGTVDVNGSDSNVTVNFTSAAFYNLTFTETGHFGGNWSVSVGNDSVEAPAGSPLTFERPNGSWMYTVGAEPGLTTSWSGTAVITGANLSLGIAFAAFGWAVEFNETGLASGTTWSVTVGNTSGSASAGAPLVFDLPNGSYTYTVGAVGQYSTPPPGGITVAGSTVEVDLTYAPPTYGVWFNETGLAPGTTWSVTVGTTGTSSTSSAIQFQLANGSYTYSIGPVTGYASSKTGGSFHVSGVGGTLRLKFTAATFTVSFNETGLPPSTRWGIAIGSAHYASTTATISVALPNGTYAFTVVRLPGYSSLHNGSFKVAGLPLGVNISFTSASFAVVFVERGLANGTAWNVTVGTTDEGSNTSNIVFDLPNGAYSYSVAPVGGYRTPANGSFTVHNYSFHIPIGFHVSSGGNGSVPVGSTSAARPTAAPGYYPLEARASRPA